MQIIAFFAARPSLFIDIWERIVSKGIQPLPFPLHKGVLFYIHGYRGGPFKNRIWNYGQRKKKGQGVLVAVGSGPFCNIPVPDQDFIIGNGSFDPASPTGAVLKKKE